MKMSGKIALIALAAVCLSAVPALSMPMGNNPGFMGHGGKFPLMNNLTAEEMGNMTLGELKEMQRLAWNNTTACLVKEPGKNCSQWERNANASLGMKGDCKEKMGMGDNKRMDGPMKDEKSGCMGAFSGKDDDSIRCDKAPQGMASASPILLLMDDLKVEDLGNMTINQIKALSEKKLQELDKMTLNQIKLLQDKKMQERENLTLNQLKEENKNMRQMAEILGYAGFGGHNKA